MAVIGRKAEKFRCRTLLGTQQHFMYFFKAIFTYLKGRVKEEKREREGGIEERGREEWREAEREEQGGRGRHRPSPASLPKWLQWLRLDQDKARDQNHHLSLPVGTGPKHSTIMYCLVRHIISRSESSLHFGKRYWHWKWHKVLHFTHLQFKFSGLFCHSASEEEWGFVNAAWAFPWLRSLSVTHIDERQDTDPAWGPAPEQEAREWRAHWDRLQCTLSLVIKHNVWKIMQDFNVTISLLFKNRWIFKSNKYMG